MSVGCSGGEAWHTRWSFWKGVNIATQSGTWMISPGYTPDEKKRMMTILLSLSAKAEISVNTSTVMSEYRGS